MSRTDGKIPSAAQQRLDVPEPPVRPKKGLPRAADLAIAAVGLVVLSPLLLAAAIAIKLESRGPVLYRQRRVGKDGLIFELFKLRTMRQGADPVGVGTAVTVDDPRVTRVGQLLRRYSLDELPNLINVLRGEMRIVGPRATLPAQVELYTPRQLRRLDLRPGVTGWAQIHGRAGIPWEERIELDVWYVEHRSLWLDLRILAKTPGALLGGAGSVAVDSYAGSSSDSPLRQAAEREQADNGATAQREQAGER
jgi:lipopolysaccharide/colanic/teichoic acid biosynthesis glycosyltransferase